MLKKLKNTLFTSDTQRQFQTSKIDKTHDFIQPRSLNTITNLILIQKKTNQILNYVYKGLHSSDLTLKIKMLVVVHACMKKSFVEDLCEIVMNYQVVYMGGGGNGVEGKNSMQSQANQKNSMQVYINNKIINFYILYLKKLYMNKQSYEYVKQYTRKIMQTQHSYQNDLQHEQNIQIVTHGFKILNLINYIFQSQEMFNKMGRYHMEHKEVLNMYMLLLDDMDQYNSYIKNSVKAIVTRNASVKSSMSNLKIRNFFQGTIQIDKVNVQVGGGVGSEYGNGEKDGKFINGGGNDGGYENYNGNMFKKQKDNTSSTKPESSDIKINQKLSKINQFKNISPNAQQIQQTKHFFLYINQSQKVSDCLYEFYHNRYYYKLIRNYISFPTFLTLQNKQYTKLKNKAKKIDKNLVNLVKKSKYDGQNTICVTSFKTQPNMKLNNTGINQLNYTCTNIGGQDHRNSVTQLDDELRNAYNNVTAELYQDQCEEEIVEEEEY